jgi:chromosome segregation ATPase
MSKQSQIFMTTFKKRYMKLSNSNFYKVEMMDSVSDVKIVSMLEANAFIENTAL